MRTLGLHLRSAQKAWSFAIVGLVLWGLFTIRKTVLVFVLALMFSYLLVPAVNMLERRLTRGARLPALLLLFLGLPLGMLCLALALHQPIVSELQALQTQVRSPEFRSNIAHWHVLGIPFGETLADAYSPSWIQQQATQWVPAMQTVVGRAGRDLLNVVLVPVLAFLILKTARRCTERYCAGWRGAKTAK